MSSYPEFICHDCGQKYGTLGPGDITATYHLGDCECCGADNLPVTSPRYYGHLKQWPIPGVTPAGPSDELVGKVLKGFDFKRVQDHMQKVDWRWANTPLEGGLPTVPTIDRLISSASSLLYRVANDPSIKVAASGGFFAEAFTHPETGKLVGLDLKFVVAENDAYLGDD